MKVRIWLVAADDSSGTWAHAFATEREAYQCQAEAVCGDDPKAVETAMRVYDMDESPDHKRFKEVLDIRRQDLDSYEVTHEDIEFEAPKDTKLLETLADIAFIAGGMRYHSGDSRADVQQFIAWAEEFEQQFTQEQNEQFEYMEAIEAFCKDKFINSGNVPVPNEQDVTITCPHCEQVVQVNPTDGSAICPKCDTPFNTEEER